MDSGSAPATAKVQHLTKASSDELLRKFAEVGSGSTAKKELSQLAKRRRHHREKITRENDFDNDEQYRENPSSSSSLSRRANLVERKSLLPAVAASTRMSSVLIPRLGIGRSRLRSRTCPFSPQLTRWIEVATSPVMLSTLEDGKVVRGLAGIPSEGPVLLVGYHMLLGLEMVPIVSSFWAKRNTLLRGIAHPMMHRNLRNGESPLIPDISTYDILRITGAVPVSATNFYKLLSSNAHVLLYPGGMREALHRKGEEYKLLLSEFVRMAARFGATIIFITFGSVGEDDIGQLLVDYDDLMKVPHIKAKIKEVAEAVMQLRTDDDGELGNQDPHLPLILPKLPGRFYNLFGKPIKTEGRKQELRNRDKSQELNLEVKSEVERCMAYLKEEREHDPYRNILPRTIYQAMHGFDCEVPTFKL